MFSNYKSSTFQTSYFEEPSQSYSFDAKMEVITSKNQDEIYDVKMNCCKKDVESEEMNNQQQNKRAPFEDVKNFWNN